MISKSGMEMLRDDVSARQYVFSKDEALIGKRCDNLQDFIYQRTMPDQFAVAVKQFTEAEREGNLTVVERRNYLLHILQIRDQLGRQRYAGVASALVYLAMSHIKEAAGKD
jgi:hypothetical protein